MQLLVCIRRDQEDRFQLYLDKTFNKTASLMAYSCKSVAILASEGTGDNSITVRKKKQKMTEIMLILPPRTWHTDMDRILGLLSS